jgi:hypothetical protein
LLKNDIKVRGINYEWGQEFRWEIRWSFWKNHR